MQPTHFVPRRAATSALALLLWLVTIGAGLLEVYFLRQAYVRLAFRLGADVSEGVFGADVLVLLLAIGWVLFTFATGEFHRLHAGQARSWRLFAWTALVEAALFGLYLVV